MKIADLKLEDLTEGEEYAFFDENNVLRHVISKMNKQLFAFISSNLVGNLYLASDIKPPEWETRPDGLQELNYDNTNHIGEKHDE